MDARVADNSFEAKVGLGSTQSGNGCPLQNMSAEQPWGACGQSFGGSFFHQEVLLGTV